MYDGKNAIAVTSFSERGLAPTSQGSYHRPAIRFPACGACSRLASFNRRMRCALLIGTTFWSFMREFSPLQAFNVKLKLPER